MCDVSVYVNDGLSIQTILTSWLLWQVFDLDHNHSTSHMFIVIMGFTHFSFEKFMGYTHDSILWDLHTSALSSLWDVHMTGS